ncbi:MAG: SsrA-binding protein SmpB [Bacteroidetes bacterium]|jgi:SsrA-binding protein|nr:MAG: SsrA-binding protein SmpB [Bacteroidota bacterium]
MSKEEKNKNPVSIQNRRASFEYEFIEKYEAGIVLTGSEIKSIREGKVNINDAYCHFKGGELYLKNAHISPYGTGFGSHEPTRERKLLLHKNELRKLHRAVKEDGMTIVPIKLYINQKGWAKLLIALAKGKKLYDKRESIKKRDVERQLKRKLK